MSGIDGAGLTDEDAVPDAPEHPISKPGDLWILGQHRVLCGDSTHGADVKRLMDGSLADLDFSDPPFNVDYQAYTKDKLKIQNDAMTPEQFDRFLCAAFTSFKEVAKPGPSLYICHASSEDR